VVRVVPSCPACPHAKVGVRTMIGGRALLHCAAGVTQARWYGCCAQKQRPWVTCMLSGAAGRGAEEGGEARGGVVGVPGVTVTGYMEGAGSSAQKVQAPYPTALAEMVACCWLVDQLVDHLSLCSRPQASIRGGGGPR
jgi:hypothetical protein